MRNIIRAIIDPFFPFAPGALKKNTVHRFSIALDSRLVTLDQNMEAFVMMVAFIAGKDRRAAYRQAPWAVASVSVRGGFMLFESADDCLSWKACQKKPAQAKPRRATGSALQPWRCRLYRVARSAAWLALLLKAR